MFAQKLDEVMLDKRISNYKMSKDTGISNSLISYWRRNMKQPTLSHLVTLSQYLEVPIDYLVTGTTAEPHSVTADFTNEERELLRNFRDLSVEKRDILVKLVKSF